MVFHKCCSNHAYNGRSRLYHIHNGETFHECDKGEKSSSEHSMNVIVGELVLLE